jgi:hypothetical protein
MKKKETLQDVVLETISDKEPMTDSISTEELSTILFSVIKLYAPWDPITENAGIIEDVVGVNLMVYRLF